MNLFPEPNQPDSFPQPVELFKELMDQASKGADQYIQKNPDALSPSFSSLDSTESEPSSLEIYNNHRNLSISEKNYLFNDNRLIEEIQLIGNNYEVENFFNQTNFINIFDIPIEEIRREIQGLGQNAEARLLYIIDILQKLDQSQRETYQELLETLIKNAEQSFIKARELSFQQQEFFQQQQQKYIDETAQKTREKIQADWDLDNWFLTISRDNAVDLFRKPQNGLSLFIAPFDISKDCPRSFSNNLTKEVNNEVNRFMQNNRFTNQNLVNSLTMSDAPDNENIWRVTFYGGDNFKRSLGKTDAMAICEILNPLPCIVIYGDILDDTLYFKAGFQGFLPNDEYSEYIYSWKWKEFQKEILKEGKTEEESLAIIRNLIAVSFKLLSIFWVDLYYTVTDIHYTPWLLQAEGSFFLKDRMDFEDLIGLDTSRSALSREVFQNSVSILKRAKINREFKIRYEQLQRSLKENNKKLSNSQCISLASKTIELAPDYARADVYLIQAELFIEAERLTDAISILDKVIDFNQNNQKAWKMRGEVFQKLQDIEQSIDSFERAISCGSGDYKVYLHLSNNYFELGSYEVALEKHELAKTCDSNLEEDSDWWFNLAMIYIQLRSYGEAKEAFVQAEKLGNICNARNFYYYYGITLENLNQLYRATQQFNIAVKRFPEDESLLNSVERVKEKIKHKEDRLVILTARLFDVGQLGFNFIFYSFILNEAGSMAILILEQTVNGTIVLSGRTIKLGNRVIKEISRRIPK